MVYWAPLSFFFFFQVLNSCYCANLVCSIGTVAIVLWFQPLSCYCFHFFFFSFFFFAFFFGVISSCPLFIYIYIYIKLLINTINCHNIFAIVDMLIPYRLKYNIILESSTTKTKGIMKKEMLHLQYFLQHCSLGFFFSFFFFYHKPWYASFGCAVFIFSFKYLYVYVQLYWLNKFL